MRHQHHDRFVEGVILGTIISDRKLSGDAAFWVGVVLFGGVIEFAFDHVGLLLILCVPALVIGFGVAALIIFFKMLHALYRTIRTLIVSIPRQWDEYLNQPPW